FAERARLRCGVYGLGAIWYGKERIREICEARPRRARGGGRQNDAIARASAGQGSRNRRGKEGSGKSRGRGETRKGRAAPAGARAQDRRGEPARRQPGAEERLADVDVAEPGDDTLVEQGGLDRGQLAGEGAVQIGAVKARLQRLGPHPGQ